MREGVWNSLGVYADDVVVGRIMWGRDDDGSHWLGGMVIDRAEQGRGLGREDASTGLQRANELRPTAPACLASWTAYVPMLPEPPMISTLCPGWTLASSCRKYQAVVNPSTLAAASA